MVLAGAVCLIFVYMAIKSPVKSIRPYIIPLALASLLLVPFFLPKTHDRYFYTAEELSIAFAFYSPRFFYIPILINLTSFFIYQPYIFDVDVFPQPVLTVAMFTAIVIVVWQVVAQLYPRNPPEDVE